MPDIDDGFEEAFKDFGKGDTPPTTPPKADPPKDEETPSDKPKEGDDPKKEEPPKEDDPKPEGTAPAGDDKKEEEDAKAPQTPEAPKDPEVPQPLTKDDVRSILNETRIEERTSTRELEVTTQEVMEAYYPDGLSNVLVDEATGKQLRTPQDVVDASGGQLNMEEAQQWLMNEQYKLDTQISTIKEDARKIAETTVNFKRDSVAVLQKYEPLFEAYPHLQKKAFELLMKQVKADDKKGVILQAPDVMDLYDTYLEPYQQAFEFSKNKPATNPPAPETEAPKPGIDDRLDIDGDGGATAPDDPNDFAQQVKKELAKGI